MRTSSVKPDDHLSNGSVARLVIDRLQVADGSIEALKWLALVLMTFDHVNKYLLHSTATAFFAGGRITLPLFAFVLAYNLARPGALERGTYGRTLRRLAFFGTLASVPFMGLGGLMAGWWPLNIMATLAVATAILYLIERGGALRAAGALALFVVGGAVGEFWWPGVAVCVASWAFCKRPSSARLGLWAVTVVALTFNGWAFARMPLFNSSLWALAAIPIILATLRTDLAVRRVRWAFYAYYPAHLAMLWWLAGSIA